MLTDEQALRLIERVRRDTPRMDVVELCDWALARLVQSKAASPVLLSTFPAEKAPKDRKAYMKEYMAKRRREKRDAGG